MKEFDLSKIDISKYEVEFLKDRDEPTEIDNMTQYLLTILNDRSIPEENKVVIRKQFDEVMRIKSITMKPPTIVLTPKESTPNKE